MPGLRGQDAPAGLLLVDLFEVLPEMKAKHTMTPEEEAAWMVRVKQPFAGVQSAAAEAGAVNPDTRRDTVTDLAAAPRIRVPVRRVKVRKP